MAIKEMTGKRFGKLSVISFAGVKSRGEASWLCKCDCGKEVVVSGGHLRSGHSISCGCGHVETRFENDKKKYIGKKFGMLTVVSYSHTSEDSRKRRYWNCLCECGKTTVISTNKIGTTVSCGCLSGEKLGMSKTSEYHIWSSMMSRCYNQKKSVFKHYGGRGISVCKEWHKFSGFFKSMGKRPKGMTLERKDNDGNYCPENCKWATMKEQSRNRRCSRKITFNGETKTISEWAEEIGMLVPTLAFRLNSGWPVKKALTQKLRGEK